MIDRTLSQFVLCRSRIFLFPLVLFCLLTFSEFAECIFVTIILSTPYQFQLTTIISLKESFDPKLHCNFCTFTPLPHEDALEERLLLDSIAWPETPLLPAPLSIQQTSDPAHSNFTILPVSGGGKWHVGDQLKVLIKMHDFQGNSKKYGGDVLLARLHNPTLGAGVAGKVVDHLNGSYTAVFSLLWEGSSQVEVMPHFKCICAVGVFNLSSIYLAQHPPFVAAGSSQIKSRISFSDFVDVFGCKLSPADCIS